MKKLLAIFIFVLFTFTACTGSNWWISGQVLGVEYDSRYPNPVYNVYTTEGHDIKITLAEGVVPISWGMAWTDRFSQRGIYPIMQV